MKVFHWVEEIAEKLSERKKEPFVVNSGMTTSGSPHMGTVCEFLYPSAIYSYLKSKGRKAEFFFEIDIMDAFDGIPANMLEHKQKLTPHLGKPLCAVPDPFGCCASYGEHFLNEGLEIIKRLGIEMPTLLKAQDLYAQGKYDPYAILFFKEIEKVKDIIERTSMRKLKSDWSPIMPVCQRCGKIATTRVLSFNTENGEYEYIDDKDIGYTKGCGFKGKNSISEHKYKITWRLDWPARQDFLGVGIEGSGVDHMTKGGSWDTAKAIHEEIFKKEPLIPYRYGFIMLDGKKYSKSKGTGFTMKELLELMPPEVLKFALLKPDLEENIDFKPDSLFMLKLIDDYSNSCENLKKIEKGEATFDSLKRNEQKDAAAAKLAGIYSFQKPLSELFMYKHIYGEWDRVEAVLGKLDSRLKRFAEAWIARGLVPEEYSFSYIPKPDQVSKEFFATLNSSMSPVDIHNAVFEFAKAKGLGGGELFKALYKALIGKEKGPKLGKLVHALGVERVRKDFGL